MGHWTIPIQWNTNYSTQIVLYNFSNLPKKKEQDDKKLKLFILQ